MEHEIYENDISPKLRDPDEVPIRDRKLVTQPYDLIVESLLSQIKNKTMFIRPLSERPRFQRNYVWSDDLASKLIESIILQVPIPPCFLSQNDEYELDVIDGQQRLYSIYRYVTSRFELRNLEVLSELNGLRFHELPSRIQKQINTFSIRCILITNDSHPDIKFEVFERLNTNTVPLNSQELRNCVYRSKLNTYLKEATEYAPWLKILGKAIPDKRLRDEEVVLRFFAFSHIGWNTYRTPQKRWLNDAAKFGKQLTDSEVLNFKNQWENSINVCLCWFDFGECFRRPGSRSVNKALFDLVMYSAQQFDIEKALFNRSAFRSNYFKLLEDDDFSDLIGRAVDHTSRVKRRREMWDQHMNIAA